MRYRESHPSYRVLVMAADNELPAREAEDIRAHLCACWTCRSRMREVESTISGFIALREDLAPELPPAAGPRELLKLRMAQTAGSNRSPIWKRFFEAIFPQRSVASAGACLLALVIVFLAPRFLSPVWNADQRPTDRAVPIPDPRITPGATLPLTKETICALDTVDAARIVPAAVANRVFAAYGIRSPEPRAYEVDYLITPALGGSDSIRNFWPQPYRGTEWNAHIKDALEDRLHELVCAGKLELVTAQTEIAKDWVGAYKKYFDTQKPLTQHVSFLKDRPWE